MFDLKDKDPIDLDKAEILQHRIAYKYFDDTSNKYLVAKIIGLKKESTNNFQLNEFRKMANLSSEPEICTVYFLATAHLEGETYTCFIEDYIDGQSLDDFITENSEISYEQSINILIELTHALEKAHAYEIYHNDLHEGNILFDQFGYMKLIDFLWTDSGTPNSDKANSDIQYFRYILQMLHDKCPEKDERKWEYITEVCSTIDSFKGLSEKLQSINDIVFDLALLKNKHKKILSTLLRDLPQDFYLDQSLSMKEVEVPPSIVSQAQGAQIIDGKIIDIQRYLNEKFFYALNPLKIADLIDYQVAPTNQGEDNIGPYVFSYNIQVRPTLIRWKTIINQYNILPSPIPFYLHVYILNESYLDLIRKIQSDLDDTGKESLMKYKPEESDVTMGEVIGILESAASEKA